MTLYEILGPYDYDASSCENDAPGYDFYVSFCSYDIMTWRLIAGVAHC
jgi:hypothetical protein